MPKRVLLSSGRTPSSLELARALAKAGCHVVVADCYPTFICQGSKTVAKTYVLPSPRQQAASFELAVLAIIREEAIDLLIPGSEEVMYLARFRLEILQLCDVFFCEADLLVNCHHKQAFNELAHSFGLPVPSSSQVSSETMAISQLQKRDFVLKRCFSRGGNAIVFAVAGTCLKACGIPFNGSWLIQEKIAGETLCAFSIAHRGQVRLTQIYVPSVTLGTIGVVFRSVKEDKILTWIDRFTKKTGYHGFISFDFIRDKSGNIFAVECNPRVTSGVHLLPPGLLAQAILNSKDALPTIKPSQSAQIAFGVLSTIPDLLENPRLLWHTIKECWRSRDVIFKWSDLWPMLYQIPCYLYFLRRSRRAGIPLSGCAMDGIEWNG